ncbi:hypothetical protein E2C01_022260 [Portunus trituberculatus]|uniref:Uncharacterized protein n=1 Tax=Portunus trituberculatus TaxID=210409 RepID=A0A5B7E771_PORTR|nr:hypothetical protein [Portunus trituberculatus]
MLTTADLGNLHITTEEVMAQLCKIDTKKVLGLSKAQAYADDCTLTYICDSNFRQDTVIRMNVVLQNFASWSRR